MWVVIFSWRCTQLPNIRLKKQRYYLDKASVHSFVNWKVQIKKAHNDWMLRRNCFSGLNICLFFIYRSHSGKGNAQQWYSTTKLIHLWCVWWAFTLCSVIWPWDQRSWPYMIWGVHCVCDRMVVRFITNHNQPITTNFMRCTRYNIMGSSLSVACDRSGVFSRYSSFLHQ